MGKTSSAILLALSVSSLSADVCVPFPISIDVTAAADDFRSLPEGSWMNNDGAYIGLNVGVGVPGLDCDGFVFQAGGSWGAYDWSGRASYPFRHPRAIQQQLFLTGGLAWKTTCCSGVNMGVVYDLMINKYFGAFGLQVNMDQIRYQVGYLWDCNDEFGLWGTNPIHTAHRSPAEVLVKYRGINQINLFWQHNFDNCAYTMIWGGVPYGKGLLFDSDGFGAPRTINYSDKRPGKFTLGFRVGAPLSSCLSIEGHASYMAPTSFIRGEESQNDSFNVAVGITYSFGGAGLCDDCGVRPYLPIADNSNFIVDTNRNY